jgi:lysine 2,3-aminomutase
MIISPEEQADPLHEESTSPVPHIVHRYPDRVLFLATGFCSAYCRYCTRTHMVSKKDKCHSNKSEWDVALDYIRSHPEIRDVLISGGDPLTLSDSRLEYLLSQIRAIQHVEIIRIGTKVPVVLPQRITPGLVNMLKKYHPLLMSIHFTHPDELTEETAHACKKLANAGIPLGSQTVLLKGINDSVEVFTKLVHELLKVRVRPYYLYQCDPIPGSSHFRTPVEKGLELIKGLRGFTSGYAIPHFVIDAPGGGGKIPLLPDYVKGKNEDGYLLINFEGKTFVYPEPAEKASTICHDNF